MPSHSISGTDLYTSTDGKVTGEHPDQDIFLNVPGKFCLQLHLFRFIQLYLFMISNAAGSKR